tara:strand:+ start:1605 stop:2084 length:480 start_codon:yes stop_codon:yes gene_type:complete
MIDKINLTKYAINYLSKFSSSKSNLEKILKNKIRRLKIDKKDKYFLYKSLNEIIEKLEKNNFINDINYSNNKIRTFAFQGKSKIFVKNYFIQKGIKTNIIDETLQNYELENHEWEINSARIFARKKRFTNTPETKEKNLSKFARAGFNYEISIKILNEI